MRSFTSVTQKGQVTIPQHIREQWGLRRGEQVEFLVEGANTIVRPYRGAENPFLQFAGALAGGSSKSAKQSRDAINRWLAGLRDEDE